jgi:hypothetical protein
MIGFIGTSLQLQSISTARNQWLSKTRSFPYWTTSVSSSTVTNDEWRIPSDWTEWRIRTQLRMNSALLCSALLCSAERQSQSQSYITTDGQPASLSWNKAPIWGLRPDLDYCLTVAGLLIWGVLPDERTGLSFAIATGPRQRSHFRVRVP